MKIIYSCFIILTFSASCTNNENSIQETNPSLNIKSGGDVLPAYSANYYDSAGLIYDELFDAYYNGISLSTDIPSVISDVEAIADANALFSNIEDGHQSISAERIQYLASSSNDSIISVIGSSSLSATAKSSFSDFLSTMTVLFDTEEDADTIYNAIIKYEDTIINNTSITTNDQRLILVTTSIMRYSSYRAKKKPKKNTDPYIDIWVTHVFGAIDGAEENIEKSILQGLATFIVSNR